MVSLFKRKLCVWQPLLKLTITHKIVPPLPAFPKSDASGNVWPTLTTTPRSLSPSVGTNPAQSLQNFQQWLDLFAMLHCRAVCLVRDLDNNRVYGLFHHMRKGEHDDFESHLSDMRWWATECQNGNISAGKYFAILPSGCGQTQMIHIRLGPLQ